MFPRNRSTQKVIIDDILNALRNFNFTNSRKVDTKGIKNVIAEIGMKHNYSVWALDIEKINDDETHIHSSNHEWLFDLIWYKFSISQDYALTELYLAMESEWEDHKKHARDDKDNYGDVKFDFQKLLVCNSPIKIMTFKYTNNNELGYLWSYFQKRINESKHTRDDEIFIFACYYCNGELNNCCIKLMKKKRQLWNKHLKTFSRRC